MPRVQFQPDPIESMANQALDAAWGYVNDYVIDLVVDEVDKSSGTTNWIVEDIIEENKKLIGQIVIILTQMLASKAVKEYVSEP